MQADGQGWGVKSISFLSPFCQPLSLSLFLRSSNQKFVCSSVCRSFHKKSKSNYLRKHFYFISSFNHLTSNFRTCTIKSKLCYSTFQVPRVININFLRTISIHNREEKLWELIKWSLKGKWYVDGTERIIAKPKNTIKPREKGVKNCVVNGGFKKQL